MTAGALDGVRVLDLTTARSGPTCVRQLADLGADVVQIAPPGGLHLAGSDAWNLHRNKRSLALDLKRPAGREVLLRLVAGADVFVENWRPAVKHRLRVGPATLWETNPALVYASISGFGQDGPYAHRPGLDQVAQGLGGLMSVTGPPGSGPWRAGVAIADTTAGTFLTVGVLAALLARRRTGRGQWVHTSLLEAMVNVMDFQAARWLIDGEAPGQQGNGHPTLAPMGTFATADGAVNVAPLGHQFARFCALIGASELADDPRFATAAGRIAARDEVDAAVGAALARRTTAEWVDLLAEEIPCGPVLSLDGVFADPQVRHLAMTATVPLADRGDIEVLRLPVTLSETPASVRSGPPSAGADTRAVLSDAGYGDDDIDRLLTSGVVAGPDAR